LPIRTLLSAIGATERRGAALASYLLFESSYTNALIELGQRDTYARKSELMRFFGLDFEESDDLQGQTELAAST
jgi:NTE family protein